MERDQALPESCKVCGITRELALFLHNIRFRGNISRLCTNCLLKNHHGMFCPICLDVYDPTPPPHLRVLCLKCPSIAHLSCVIDVSNSDAPVPAFHCPSCADAKFSYFKLDRSNPSIKEAKNADEEGDPVSVTAQKANAEGDSVCVSTRNANEEGSSVSVSAQKAQNSRTIDIEMAKALLAAARIAASSMNRAVAAARINAEQRCKEAARARKKAQEALERLASIVAKDLDAEDDSVDAEDNSVDVEDDSNSDST